MFLRNFQTILCQSYTVPSEWNEKNSSSEGNTHIQISATSLAEEIDRGLMRISRFAE